MVPFERALVTSYRLSIVTFPLSLVFTRFRNIAAFVLQHDTTTYYTELFARYYALKVIHIWVATSTITVT